MKRHSAVALLVLLMGLAVASLPADAKDKAGDSGRLLTGKVVDKQDAPLASSVVYLANTRTRAVKTLSSARMECIFPGELPQRGL